MVNTPKAVFYWQSFTTMQFTTFYTTTVHHPLRSTGRPFATKNHTCCQLIPITTMVWYTRV